VSDVPDLVAPRPKRIGREAVAVGLIGLATACVQLRVWRAHLSEPFTSGGDGNFYAMVVQGLARHGKYFDNPDLGWPFAQQLHDLPQGADNFNYLILRGLVAIVRSPWGAINSYFLLSFATVAALAYVALRLLGIRRWVAVVVALVYDFAPYHFVRGEQHLLLSAYHFVPLIVLLALSMFEREPPLSRHRADGKVRPTLRKNWWVVALVAAVASSGAYYLIFALGLVGTAAVLSAIRRPSWRPIVSAAVVTVIGGAVFAANVSPTLLFTLRNGANTGVAARAPSETELYGLKITQLFLPRYGHRIQALANLTQKSQGRVVVSESGQQLGLIGAIGLVLIIGAFVAAAMGRTRSRLGQRLVPLGMLAIACAAVATVSGFSLYLSAAGLSYIRSWNRISIVIAFLALIGFAYAVEWWLDREKRSRRTVAALASALLLVTAFDQFTPTDIPPYAPLHATAVSNAQLFKRVFADQGRDAKVFMWPDEPFPEAYRRGGTDPYDQATGYIFEPRLRYSFGFVSGRHPEYGASFETKPATEWLTDAVAIGFRALVVDRTAVEGQFKVPDVEPSLTPVLGDPTMVSANGRYAYYDLRTFAAASLTQFGADTLAARATTVLAGKA
jgi:phosphoglycerol transferase